MCVFSFFLFFFFFSLGGGNDMKNQELEALRPSLSNEIHRLV